MSTFFLLTLVLSLLFRHALTQQAYYSTLTTADCTVHHAENAGYVCAANKTSCDTVAYFRVQPSSSTNSFSTLNSISSSLFNLSSSSVMTASSLSSTNVIAGEGLYIPLTCTCYGNHTSQNVTYTILPGDTFLKIANDTYEGLTTCQALQDANPTAIVTDLQIGQKVILPIRCACPSEAQVLRGIVSLVTYPVADNDTVDSVVNMFGATQQEFVAANNLSNASVPLFAGTTVLVPFLVKPEIPPNASSSSSPSPSTSSTPLSSSSPSSKTGIYVGVPVGIVALLLIAAFVFVFVRKAKKKSAFKDSLVPTIPPEMKPPAPLKSAKMQGYLQEGMIEFAGSEKLTSFTLEEIKEATQDFSPTTQIRGAVYRGVLKGRVVAVKNVTRNVSKELHILQKVHHANLITLLGTCIATPEQSYLVYEFAENGSLSDWLHGTDLSAESSSSSILAWNNRLQVALDVATALEYIHDHTSPSYVHKDIKSSNILLDSKFRGKIANFAMAKLTTDGELTMHIVGTRGYMAPEYLAQGVVSPQIDVFAFGVVLLEILSGKEAVMRNSHVQDMFLYEAVSNLLSDAGDGKEELKAWMDPHLQNAYPLDCAYSVALLARSCVAKDPKARPKVRDVAYTLAKVLEISLEWEPSIVLENYNDNPLQAR